MSSRLFEDLFTLWMWVCLGASLVGLFFGKGQEIRVGYK